MGDKKKKKKIRADFRKNRTVRVRQTDWTRQFDEHGFDEEDPAQSERISGKGEITRKRTIRGRHLIWPKDLKTLAPMR